MKEEWEKDVLGLFVHMWTSCFCIANKTYLQLISNQLFNWILKRGISETCSVALSNFAFSIDEISDARMAYDVAQFGCALLERYPSEPLRCRTISVFACGVSPKIMPLDHAIPLLVSSRESALECSNLPIACYITHQTLAYLYFKGTNFVEMSQAVSYYLDFLKRNNMATYGFAIGVTTPFRFHSKDSFSEDQFMSEEQHSGNPATVAAFWVGKSQTLGWREDQD
eukprot:TRINITY_DN1409_c1_g1_i1.p1 TRINITY_DN1409_c1_g1~~TRINITY_DN1409_c1_g1_i1.p1  ORF type:complete len:225 (-),score=43.38 TRINITY_DN1409_c1_g1_i1:4-678(-)